MCLRDALGDLFYCMPTEETIDVSLLDLPLKETDDVYHSSIGVYPDNSKLYRDTIYKRFTDKETYKLTKKQQKGRIKTNQGHFKDFMINLPILITDNVTFYCNGDKNTYKNTYYNKAKFYYFIFFFKHLLSLLGLFLICDGSWLYHA